MNILFFICFGFVYFLLYNILLKRSEVNSDDKLLEVYQSEKKVIGRVCYYNCLLLSFLFGVNLGLFAVTKEFSLQLLIVSVFLLIIGTQMNLAFVTDKIAHRVDRHINRLGYVFTIILSLLFVNLFYSDFAIEYYTKIFVVELVTIILMFIITSIGSADFRILLMVNAVSIVLWRKYLYLAIGITFIFAALYQFIIQRSKGDRKASVPIGHIFLLSVFLQTLLYLIYMN